MAESTFKHLDDDGSLSLFASSDNLIISCEHGHYWIVNSPMVESKDEVGAVLSATMGSDEVERYLNAF